MLPTEKKSRLALQSINNKLELYNNAFNANGSREIYIISDEKIKERDWAYNKQTNKVFKFKHNEGNFSDIGIFKIVATTDKSLKINKKESTGIGYIDYLPKLPESFIQAYIKAYNDGKPITEVLIEYQKACCKNGHILINCLNICKDVIYIPKIRDDNTVIIHQSKMYSREQVIELCAKAWDESLAVNVHKKDALPTNVHTTEPVHFNKFIQDNL